MQSYLLHFRGYSTDSSFCAKQRTSNFPFDYRVKNYNAKEILLNLTVKQISRPFPEKIPSSFTLKHPPNKKKTMRNSPKFSNLPQTFIQKEETKEPSMKHQTSNLNTLSRILILPLLIHQTRMRHPSRQSPLNHRLVILENQHLIRHLSIQIPPCMTALLRRRTHTKRLGLAIGLDQFEGYEIVVRDAARVAEGEGCAKDGAEGTPDLFGGS